MTAVRSPARKAAPAFAPNPHRRALLAKIHLAKKMLGLIDDDYRAILSDVVGVVSAANATDAQLDRLAAHFQSIGFKPVTRAGPNTKAKGADHPVAKKARAMWISLYHLCAIDSPDEGALEAFACRQLGVVKFQWADQTQGFKLIEALKAMAERHYWSQRDLPKVDIVRVLKIRLCDALLKRLKKATVVPAAWTLDVAAFRLLGIENPHAPAPWDLGDLDRIAAGLGTKLRAWRG
jgi:phage gp16-like protein